MILSPGRPRSWELTDWIIFGSAVNYSSWSQICFLSLWISLHTFPWLYNIFHKFGKRRFYHLKPHWTHRQHKPLHSSLLYPQKLVSSSEIRLPEWSSSCELQMLSHTTWHFRLACRHLQQSNTQRGKSTLGLLWDQANMIKWQKLPLDGCILVIFIKA